MTITQERKQELITEYQSHETDTGSPELQIAIMTERIKNLTEHLKVNQKDHSSRRGLLKLIGKRKSLLKYVNQGDSNKYKELITRLGIRG